MTDVTMIEMWEPRVPYPVPGRDRIGGHVILYGFAFRETGGVAVAEIDLFDGTDNTGLLAIPIAIPAAGVAREWYGPQGLHFRVGLFPLITGAVAGSLFVHLETHEHRRP